MMSNYAVVIILIGMVSGGTSESQPIGRSMIAATLL